MIEHGKIDGKRIVSFDPEATHHATKKKQEIVNKLMDNPSLLDVVVTWQVGARS